MKKNLLFFLFLAGINMYAYGQFPNGPQYLGNSKTLVEDRGGFKATGGFINASFADTTTANLGYIKAYPYAQIVVGGTIYIRNAAATAWVPSGGLGWDRNIYNYSSRLTGSRNISGFNTYKIQFDSVLFLVRGVHGTGTTLDDYGESQMFFYPLKSAFRAGKASGGQFFNSNIGDYSAAFGFNVQASSTYTFGAGLNNVITGTGSFGAGVDMIISGSTSFGYGNNSRVTAANGMTISRNSIVSGISAGAFGLELYSKAYAGTVIGLYNDSTDVADSAAWNANNRIFQVGNGKNKGIFRSNAMTILQGGNVGIATLTPTAKLHTLGTVRHEGLSTSNDTSTYKPPGLDNDGNLVQMTYWPGIGGDGGITALTGDVTASGTGSVSATIANNAVSNAKFRQSSGLSLVGRSANSTGDVADITAGSDKTTLARNGTSLAFVALDSTYISTLHTEAYYNTKYVLSSAAGLSLRNTGSSGDGILTEIDATTAGFKKLIAGSGVTITPGDSSLTIAFTGGGITALTGDVTASGTGSVAATIANNAVSNAKFRQSSGLSLVGRSANSTGDVADITAGSDKTTLARNGTSLDFVALDSTYISSLHTEAYYNTKYVLQSDPGIILRNTGATGESILTQISSTIAGFKKLIGGSGVTFTSADSSITADLSAIASGRVLGNNTTASAAPVAIGAWMQLTTGTASGAATIDIDLTNYYTVYDEIKISFYDIRPATDNVSLYMRISADGTTYAAGASDYKYQILYGVGATAGGIQGSGNAQILLANNVDNTSTNMNTLDVVIKKPGQSTLKPMYQIRLDYVGDTGPAYVTTQTTGLRDAAQVTRAVRFLASSGNINGGYSVQGIKY